MAKQIRMPDRAQQMYTERNYMDALCRADGDEKLALAQEEERGFGFGFMYMKLIHETLEDSKNPTRSRNRRELNDMGMELGSSVVKNMINDEFSGVRRVVCSALNRYANRRGMIDVWPKPDAAAGITVHGWEDKKRTEDFKVPFSFFAPDYSIRREGRASYLELRGAPEVHRFRSEVPVPEELRKARARCEELRKVKKPTEKQRRSGMIRTAFSFFPLAIALLCAGALLLWALTGAKTNESMGDLALLYEFMTSNIFVFISMFVGVVMSGLIGTGILRLILAPEIIPKEDVRRGMEAQKELERIENDPHIEKIWQEYRRRRAQEEEQVNAWQEEWFEVCRLKRGM